MGLFSEVSVLFDRIYIPKRIREEFNKEPKSSKMFGRILSGQAIFVRCNIAAEECPDPTDGTCAAARQTQGTRRRGRGGDSGRPDWSARHHHRRQASQEVGRAPRLTVLWNAVGPAHAEDPGSHPGDSPQDSHPAEARSLAPEAGCRRTLGRVRRRRQREVDHCRKAKWRTGWALVWQDCTAAERADKQTPNR